MEKITNFKRLMQVTEADNKKIFEVTQELEARMQERSVKSVRATAKQSLEVMKSSIKEGIEHAGLSPSGMSGLDAAKILKRYETTGRTAFNKLPGKILAYAVAIVEENMRMGRIVACPTAGACGILPAVIIGYSEEFGFTEEEQVNALVTAGMIGKLAAEQIQLAGAVGGCQAECGVASAMAAGAAVELMGGNNEQIMHSATLALKNILGLVCDPVAGLVEVPCIKRNGFLAIHAITASEMALAGVESFIPADEVLQSMKQVGVLMSPMLKESSEAGLAITETAKKVKI